MVRCELIERLYGDGKFLDSMVKGIACGGEEGFYSGLADLCKDNGMHTQVKPCYTVREPILKAFVNCMKADLGGTECSGSTEINWIMEIASALQRGGDFTGALGDMAKLRMHDGSVACYVLLWSRNPMRDLSSEREHDGAKDWEQGIAELAERLHWATVVGKPQTRDFGETNDRQRLWVALLRIAN